MVNHDTQNLLFREAHTTYGFSDEPVSDETVRAVYDMVKYGPTALNSQPLRILLARSPEARERVRRHMYEGNKAKIGAAPLVALLAADLDFHRDLPMVFPVSPDAAKGFEADEAGRVATARFNAAIQIGYFIVGVRAAGLAAGPMAGFDGEALSKEFYPDGDHQVISVVNLGRAAGTDSHFPRQPRLDYQEVVTSA